MNKMKIFDYVWKKLCQFLFLVYEIQTTNYKIQNTKYNYGDDTR